MGGPLPSARRCLRRRSLNLCPPRPGRRATRAGGSRWGGLLRAHLLPVPAHGRALKAAQGSCSQGCRSGGSLVAWQHHACVLFCEPIPAPGTPLGGWHTLAHPQSPPVPPSSPLCRAALLCTHACPPPPCAHHTLMQARLSPPRKAQITASGPNWPSQQAVAAAPAVAAAAAAAAAEKAAAAKGDQGGAGSKHLSSNQDTGTVEVGAGSCVASGPDQMRGQPYIVSL